MLVSKLPDGSCPAGSTVRPSIGGETSLYGEFVCEAPDPVTPPVTVKPTLVTTTVPVTPPPTKNPPPGCAPGYVSVPNPDGGSAEFICVQEMPSNRSTIGTGDQTNPTTGTGDQTNPTPPPVMSTTGTGDQTNPTPPPVMVTNPTPSPTVTVTPTTSVMPSPMTRSLPTLTQTPTTSSRCDCVPVANPYQAQTNEVVRFPAVGGTLAYGVTPSALGYAPAPAGLAYPRYQYVPVRAAGAVATPTSGTFATVGQWAAFAVAAFVGYKTVQRMYG